MQNEADRILFSVRKQISKRVGEPYIDAALNEYIEAEVKYGMRLDLAERLMEAHCVRHEDETTVSFQIDVCVASPAVFWNLVEEEARRIQGLLTHTV